ncbi:50S ribosomal protein L4 [Candidatus Aerophobetes bacterium]|nr:50S ribosomal protein L4 [Candidatus Aerophobetes bacterium]
MQWNVYNTKGEIVEVLELDDEIFAGEVNQPLLREAYIAYQANLRQGTASTRTRGEVRGGGRKPWPQKHTGRARAGSIRSPLWVGGGTVFGPKPRSYKQRFPRKKRRLALISALRLKVKEGKLVILDKLELEEGKTKELSAILNSFSATKGIDGKTLFVTEKKDEKLSKASSNIKNLRLVLAGNVCSLHVMMADNVFFTRESLEALTRRLKNE